MKNNFFNGTAATSETRNMNDIAAKTGNIYASLSIISKRANQMNLGLREELHSKLNEFASTSDNLEEIFENREQIEISKHYEKLPNPALLAFQEFMEDKTYYRFPNEDVEVPSAE